MTRQAVLTRTLTFAAPDGDHVGALRVNFEAGDRVRLLKIVELAADVDAEDFGAVEAYNRRREGRTIIGGNRAVRDPEDVVLARIGDDRRARLLPRDAIAFDDGVEISRALCDAAATWRGRPVEAATAQEEK